MLLEQKQLRERLRTRDRITDGKRSLSSSWASVVRFESRKDRNSSVTGTQEGVMTGGMKISLLR